MAFLSFRALLLLLMPLLLRSNLMLQAKIFASTHTATGVHDVADAVATYIHAIASDSVFAGFTSLLLQSVLPVVSIPGIAGVPPLMLMASLLS
jgi:hypothetical protein